MSANNFGQIVFGAGTVILTPYAANGPANPTPLQLPIMQDMSIDFSGDIAELYGQGQYSYAIARTKMKIECKAKFGAMYYHLLNDLFFAGTLQSGQIMSVLREANTVTSHTCTVANAAHFLTDSGVLNQATGQPYILVASAPAVGQYTVTSGGVYAFNASDTIATALISYTWTNTTGNSFLVTNQDMGAMPTFLVEYTNQQFGNNVYFKFFKGVAKKLSIPGKNTDFDMVEFDFSCFSSITGSVFEGALDL